MTQKSSFNLNNGRTSRRVTARFVAVISVSLALGVFTYSEVVTIGAKAEAITRDSLPEVYSAASIRIQ